VFPAVFFNALRVIRGDGWVSETAVFLALGVQSSPTHAGRSANRLANEWAGSSQIARRHNDDPTTNSIACVETNRSETGECTHSVENVRH
jgi:hypothetical protein